MSLPSQEVLDDIKDLISEITGFKEDDENFAICERYCLSHVLHHTYPFVNRTTVKNLVNSYVSRFYGHGYFKVSQELNCQVKSFLNNEKLFEKNPQYDIQWSLLSLVSSLSSNLTLVKDIPELLPIDDEESELEDFNWKEYLLSDLPQNKSPSNGNEELSREEGGEDDLSMDEEKDEKADESKGNKESSSTATIKKSCKDEKNLEVIFDNKNVFSTLASSEVRRQRIEEFLKSRRFKQSLDQDLAIRGKFAETFDSVLNQEGIIRKSQYLSEFEIMENILFQFQTGERIFLRKGLVNPALTSVTRDTLGSYLGSLQPYFKIIRCLRDFDVAVTESRYPEKCLDKSSNHPPGSGDAGSRNIPNVLYMYNVTLRKALEPFQDEVTEIVENMGNYTILQMERKLQPYYHYLTSLYSVHKLATKDLDADCNWMSSIRILSVLFNAIMEANSTKLSFLYLNIFLHCFQVYLNIIDSWISFVTLIDPNDEFIVAKSGGPGNSESKFSEYMVRPYKTKIEDLGVKKVLILDLISEKMIHVGQSLEVLKRLNRFVTPTGETPSRTSSYQLLVETIKEEIRNLGKVDKKVGKKDLRPPEKAKSIFTTKSVRFGLERDGGGGDPYEIESIFLRVLKEDEEDGGVLNETVELRKSDKYCNNFGEFIKSVVKNPFFKMTFDEIGMKQVHKQLERAKRRQKQKDETLLVIQNPEEGKSGIYPFHKIITESFHKILENRVSGPCALVRDIVLKECNLLTHLSLLRSILLFSDSYLIQPFILALYGQSAIWGSSYSLSLHLKECVRSFYNDYANSLSVVLTKNSGTKCENILQVIDVITVEYEVTWPLTLIITPEALRKYNEIFRFALKLKWAHWVVCGLHFLSALYYSGKHEKGSKSVCHRLQLLRFWLLSALGRINNYFLAQITPLDVRLGSCNDLKDIIQGHSKYLEETYHNCLLGEKCPEARKLILEKLIPLCMDLFSMSDDINEEKLSSMEKTFKSCNPLLSELLSSLEK